MLPLALAYPIPTVGASSGMARFLSRSSTGIRVTHPAPMRSKRHGRLCGSRSRQESMQSICSKRPRRRSTTSRPNWPMSGSPGMRRFSAWTARSRLSNRLSRACGRNWPPSGSSGRSAEQERDDAIAARQEAEERLREVLAAKDARKLSPASSKPTNDPAGGSDKVKQARRRGRPAKSDQSEAEFVEWWKPGWRDRLR